MICESLNMTYEEGIVVNILVRTIISSSDRFLIIETCSKGQSTAVRYWRWLCPSLDGGRMAETTVRGKSG
jgi:hypothetical protein